MGTLPNPNSTHRIQPSTVMPTATGPGRRSPFDEPAWVDTTSVSTHRPYTVVDLCCGCGGFTLGFLLAGYLPRIQNVSRRVWIVYPHRLTDLHRGEVLGSHRHKE